jgi:LPXTG-site transpeptidase (sortase) family protein
MVDKTRYLFVTVISLLLLTAGLGASPLREGPANLSSGSVAHPPDQTFLLFNWPLRIVIPAIGVDTTIMFTPYAGQTWDVSRLTWQVGYLQGTATPGQGGNVVLAAHRYLEGANEGPGPFSALGGLYPGALVEVYAGANIYVYQVTQQMRVGPEDIWVVYPTGTEQLTLLTCDGWNPNTRSFEQRLVVSASPVEVRPLFP